MYLNQNELINRLTKTNKSYVVRIANNQLKKYGNEEVWSARIGLDYDYVQIDLGERWIIFNLNSNGEVWHTSGTLQGSKYETRLKQIALELYNKREK